MDNKYYIARDGKPQGPYTVSELLSQNISPETFVWNKTMTEWTKAGDVSELNAILFAPTGDPAFAPGMPGLRPEGGRQHTVSFTSAVRSGFQNYCKFRGRASRSEFWWFIVFYYIVQIGIIAWITSTIPTSVYEHDMNLIMNSGSFSLLGYNNDIYQSGLMQQIRSNPVYLGFSILMILPLLGLAWRRLHDIGRTGAWLLLAFIPVAGPIVLFVFFCLPSQKFTNEYGPVPNLK